MDQDETWRADRPQPSPHCVRWKPSSPFPKRRRNPQFSANVCCGQMAAWIKMPLGMEVDLDPSDFVLDGDPAPLPKKGRSPHFSAHFYCRMALCIRIPLGTEIGLSPGDIVLDRDQAPTPLKRHNPPIFGQYPLWPNGWME